MIENHNHYFDKIDSDSNLSPDDRCIPKSFKRGKPTLSFAFDTPIVTDPKTLSDNPLSVTQ
jgi:hypothetical protein